MKVIYKYAISDNIALPDGAEILYANHQPSQGKAFIWALVDPDQEFFEIRNFRIHGTGFAIAPNEKHIATWQEGPFVWHLFEVVEEQSKGYKNE